MTTLDHFCWRSTPLALALLLLVACSSAPPVRVEHVHQHDVRRQLETSALTSMELSPSTAWLLRLIEGEELFEREPEAVLRALQELAAQSSGRAPRFALSELAFLTAKRRESRTWYLAAAVYAYDYLLGTETDEPVSHWDRRFRWACDIYNYSIARAFHAPEEGCMSLTGGRFELPTGVLDVEVDTSNFPYEVEGLKLMLADELRVVGLSFRVRNSGLGAPLIAVIRRQSDGTPGAGLQEHTSLPATAFLRIEGNVSELDQGLTAKLELHQNFDKGTLGVGDLQVPLEADLSTTIAYSTQSANLWRFDIRGLFGNSQAERQNGLILTQPYLPGRIPVVLVHGTASNPSYWAELYNSLSSDPDIRDNYQVWLFLYTTGAPIAYSAASLREELTELVERCDPEGKDEALQKMVLVGHSQGGLLVKMAGLKLTAEATSQRVLQKPLEDLDLDAKQEALYRRLYDVEPLPFVDRIVFVATPHRGSFLAKYWLARFVNKLVSVPKEVKLASERVLKRFEKEELPKGVRRGISTSLDNMNPNSPLLMYLAETPMDPRIHLHSIIPIGDSEEPEGADDGVVTYESAHIDGVESERLIPSPHSCQEHPRFIVEMWGILREHAGLQEIEVKPASKPAASKETGSDESGS